MENIKDFAEKLASDFSLVTGIECSVVDIDSESQDQNVSACSFCSVCKKYGTAPISALSRHEVLRSFCLQSEQWGGKYESLCPLSLAFISTMIYGKNVRYGLCLGPVLMVEVDDFIAEDIASHFDPDVRDQVTEAVMTVPHIEASRVSAYSDMLYMAACYATQRSSLDINVLAQVDRNNKEQYYYIKEAKDSSVASYPIQTEAILMNHIANGNRRAAQSELNQLVSRIYLNAGGDIKIVKIRVNELLTLLSRAAIEGGADVSDVFSMNESFISALEKIRTLNELNPWLADVMLKFSNSVFESKNIVHSDTIKEIVSYIRDNYMVKIRLEDIAAHVDRSVSYICRIFKDEMHMRITEYINSVRINNAKALLLEKDITLSDIAYLSGFEDNTYFSKVFKKETGFTPGKFRIKRGKMLSYSNIGESAQQM